MQSVCASQSSLSILKLFLLLYFEVAPFTDIPFFEWLCFTYCFFFFFTVTCTEWHSYFQSHPHPLPPRPLPPVSKCSPLKRWCPICHMWAKRDHALLFSITEFSSCQLRWDRRRSRWVAVSAINQHEIFSFEYTHHLLLLLLSLLETPQKELGCLSEAFFSFFFCNWDHVRAVAQFLVKN